MWVAWCFIIINSALSITVVEFIFEIEYIEQKEF